MGLRNVLRRWIALFATMFVLFGTISPAIACAVQAGDGDCCPSGHKMPCGGGEPGHPPASVTECFVTGAHVSASTVGEHRAQQLAQPSVVPDPVIAVAWLATFVPPSSLSHAPPPSQVSIARDSEPIYLRTLRLRL